MRALIIIMSLFLGSWSALRPCAARDLLSFADEARKTTFEEMRADVLQAWGDDHPPQSLIDWIGGEIARMQAAQLPADELWFRRERKDPNARGIATCTFWSAAAGSWLS